MKLSILLSFLAFALNVTNVQATDLKTCTAGPCQDGTYCGIGSTTGHAYCGCWGTPTTTAICNTGVVTVEDGTTPELEPGYVATQLEDASTYKIWKKK